MGTWSGAASGLIGPPRTGTFGPLPVAAALVRWGTAAATAPATVSAAKQHALQWRIIGIDHTGQMSGHLPVGGGKSVSLRTGNTNGGAGYFRDGSRR
jgi:hypothetical protein